MGILSNISATAVDISPQLGLPFTEPLHLASRISTNNVIVGSQHFPSVSLAILVHMELSVRD
jgi:hypothetical protein